MSKQQRHRNRMKAPAQPESVVHQFRVSAGQKASALAEQAEECVSEHPASSALVTFACGLLLGGVTAWLLTPVRRQVQGRNHWYDEPRRQYRDWSRAASKLPETASRFFSGR